MRGGQRAQLSSQAGPLASTLDPLLDPELVIPVFWAAEDKEAGAAAAAEFRAGVYTCALGFFRGGQCLARIHCITSLLWVQAHEHLGGGSAAAQLSKQYVRLCCACRANNVIHHGLLWGAVSGVVLLLVACVLYVVGARLSPAAPAAAAAGDAGALAGATQPLLGDGSAAAADLEAQAGGDGGHPPPLAAITAGGAAGAVAAGG